MGLLSNILRTTGKTKHRTYNTPFRHNCYTIYYPTLNHQTCYSTLMEWSIKDIPIPLKNLVLPAIIWCYIVRSTRRTRLTNRRISDGKVSQFLAYRVTERTVFPIEYLTHVGVSTNVFSVAYPMHVSVAKPYSNHRIFNGNFNHFWS